MPLLLSVGRRGMSMSAFDWQAQQENERQNKQTWTVCRQQWCWTKVIECWLAGSLAKLSCTSQWASSALMSVLRPAPLVLGQPLLEAFVPIQHVASAREIPLFGWKIDTENCSSGIHDFRHLVHFLVFFLPFYQAPDINRRRSSSGVATLSHTGAGRAS